MHRNKQTSVAMLYIDQRNRPKSAEKDLTSDRVLSFIIEMLAVKLLTWASRRLKNSFWKFCHIHHILLMELLQTITFFSGCFLTICLLFTLTKIWTFKRGLMTYPCKSLVIPLAEALVICWTVGRRSYTIKDIILFNDLSELSRNNKYKNKF